MAQKLFDDLGRDVLLGNKPPARIVSLVPSETLNVVRLGAGDRLVGRTDYCVDPPELAERVPSVGGTKNPRGEDIIALEPDLVLANQEENSRGDLEKLAQAQVRVFVSFPKRVAEGLAHLARLARMLKVQGEPEVKALIARGYAALRDAEAARASNPPVRAFVPIWMSPLMTIHGDTFLSDMLDLSGAYNVFCDRPRRYPLAADLGRAPALPPEKLEGRDTRYPRITLDEVVARAPELILLPDEPHPFSAADAEVFRKLDIPAAKTGRIAHCPGKDLSWPGVQSIEGLARARALITRLVAGEGAS
jgi:ABC-type Fe3+-hydroxamate transport system substrate-binding protein